MPPRDYGLICIDLARAARHPARMVARTPATSGYIIYRPSCMEFVLRFCLRQRCATMLCQQPPSLFQHECIRALPRDSVQARARICTSALVSASSGDALCSFRAAYVPSGAFTGRRHTPWHDARAWLRLVTCAPIAARGKTGLILLSPPLPFLSPDSPRALRG